MKLIMPLLTGLMFTVQLSYGQYGEGVDDLDGAVNFYDEYETASGTTKKIKASQKVKLVGFEAVPMINESNNRSVTIKWKTIKEKDNSHYIVQHSKNGVHFTDIGTIKGSGNCSEDMIYEVEDKNPFEGTTYYRLKQISFNRKVAYSNVATSQFRKMQGIIAYNNKRSNPEGVNIILETTSSANANVKIFTALGKQAFAQQISLKNGMNDISLETKSIPKGKYNIIVSINEDLYTATYEKKN